MANNNLNGYSIVAEENGGFSVYKDGNKCDNAKGAMREIAALVGLEVDPAWTTRQLGSKLQKMIGGQAAPKAAPAKNEEKAKPVAAKKEDDKPAKKTDEKTDKEIEMEEEIKRLKAELAKAKEETKPKAEKPTKKSNDPFEGLMVDVCAGMYVQKYEYLRYTNHGDKRRKKEWYHCESDRRVTISKEFQLCKYPVTQGQWKTIMGEGFNPSHFRGDDNLPVESVTIEEVNDFITKLNKLTGKHYGLPTEAEWQWAASGAAKDDDLGDWAGCKDEAELEKYAWYRKNSEYKTHPVGQKKPNELGLYDMSGNVWEICCDKLVEYDDETHRLGFIDVTDPIKTAGERNIIKGGSFDSNASNTNSSVSCKNSGYGSTSPGHRSLSIGFRLALRKE